MLWWAIVAIALATAPFVWWPLRKHAGEPAGNTSRLDALRALYTTRAAELERERAEGLLSEESFDQARAELDRRALVELENERSAGVEMQSSTAPAGVVVGAVGLVVAAVVLAYAWLGEPAAPALADAAQVLELKDTDTVALERWQTLLASRVAAEPEERQVPLSARSCAAEESVLLCGRRGV